MPKKFKDAEHEYLAWLEQHPHGFVVNTTPGFSRFRKMHRATCSDISTYTLEGRGKPGGFTERQYIKICDTNRKSLEQWHRQNQGQGSIPACKKCKPYDKTKAAISLSNLQEIQDALLLERLREDLPEDRNVSISSSSRKPTWVTVKIKIPVRNQDVRAAVLRGAKGKCQDCGNEAPFKKRDGSPYLEVHHKKPLARNGDDTVQNAQALCPNCHRKAHYEMG